MKQITCLTTLSAMLCVAGPLTAAPQNAPAPPPPRIKMILQDDQADPETQIKANLEARRAAEQRQAALTDSQAAQNAVIEYQRAMALVADQGTAGRSDRPLLIRYSETDPKSLAAMNEDMNIMGRILDKAVRQSLEDGQREAMGIRLATVPVPDGARNVQIEGYGAVFQLGVNFPLVGPPVEKSDDAVDKGPTNSAWDETRRELYGPRGRGGRRGGPGVTVAAFDSKRVEGLKNSILDALKNASNMRNLKSEESVTVVVTSSGGPSVRAANPAAFGGGGGGGTGWSMTANRIQVGDKLITSDGSNLTMQTLVPAPSPGSAPVAPPARAGSGGGGTRGGGGGFGGGGRSAEPAADAVYDERTGSMIMSTGTGSNRTVRVLASPSSGQRGGPGVVTESVLTIRAKKSDIDAFAKGRLGLDEFRSRASVQIY